MNTADLKNDISSEIARRAYDGVSMFPEKRAESCRNEYAQTMETDYAELLNQAERGKTLDLLPAEFERYRAGYRRRYIAYLHSSSRCVSSFIAGPSNFPAARMNKRADIAHKRLNEFLEFRGRALAAIKRTLRPDLSPIYASDDNALERLEAKITKAENYQSRMKLTNATIRKHAKTGPQAQIAALLELGYQMNTAAELIKPDFCGRIGFADYELTNNSANIRRMKSRVEQISALKAASAQVIEGESARFEDAPQDNRVRLFFPGKPAESVRANLKRAGFRWSPTLGCWQAFRNYSATQAAKLFAGLNQDEELAKTYANTCESFRRKIEGISRLANLPVWSVFTYWREYSKNCSDSDQSPILGEFVEWYSAKLGGDRNALQEVLRENEMAIA